MRHLRENDHDGDTAAKRRGRRLAHRRRTFAVLLMIALIANALAVIHEAPRALELTVRDALFVLRDAIAPPTPPDDIVVVAIDEASMLQIGHPWPWPRSIHARLIDTLTAGGASVIGMDFFFVEPTSDDDRLTRSMTAAGNVILAADTQYVEESGYLLEVDVRSHPAIEDSALAVGQVAVPQDLDGFVRHIRLAVDGQPAFGRVLAERHMSRRGGNAKPRKTGMPLALPVAESEPVTLDFVGPVRSIPTVSYAQALEPGALPASTFRDRIVVVGLDLAASPQTDRADKFAWPLLGVSGSRISGAELHATVADMLLRQRFLPRWHPAAQVALFTLFLIAGATLLWRLRGWRGPVAFVTVVAIFITTHSVLFIAGGVTTSVFTPAAVLLLFLLAERLYSYHVIDSDMRLALKALRHYISPDVVKRIVENPDELSLYGEYYETTIVFTDLVGFTSLAENLTPMELRDRLTEYFDGMIEEMLRNDGTLDKFVGDAMMCFFGVPERVDDHPQRGLRTAWAMRRWLDTLNARWSSRGLPPMRMRIGVNSGRVSAGNMGSSKVFNYTIMGDAVNLAARLESANKQYGTEILVGEETFKLAKDEFDFRRVDRIRVKGKTDPTDVFELLGPRGTLSDVDAARHALYGSAFDDYLAGRFEHAIGHLDTLLAGDDDMPARILRARCEAYIEEAPPADWGGVYTMRTK